MRWRVSDAHRSVGIGPTLGLRALQLYSYPPNTPACSLLSSRNTHQNHPCLEKKREARARMPFRVCGTCIVLCAARSRNIFLPLLASAERTLILVPPAAAVRTGWPRKRASVAAEPLKSVCVKVLVRKVVRWRAKTPRAAFSMQSSEQRDVIGFSSRTCFSMIQ